MRGTWGSTVFPKWRDGPRCRSVTHAPTCSGRFRVDAPRTSSSRHEAFGAIALAPGYGVGWVVLDPDDDQPTADITLRPEQVIHGRLFDLQGRPVPNVTLSVTSIRRAIPREPVTGLEAALTVSFIRGRRSMTFRPGPSRLRPTPRAAIPCAAWAGNWMRSSPSITRGSRSREFRSETNGASQSKPMTAALIPAQIITGRVTYADTGKGVPHAPLEALASHGRAAIVAGFETDADGRFRVNPPPADGVYNVSAYPPEGEPYLMDHKRIEWPKGALEQSLELALPRGVLIRGKVTEEGSGKPVPGAMVDFVRRGERGAQGNAGIPQPMARFNSEPRPDRVTYSSGALATITCYAKSAIGWLCKASRAAAGSTHTPTACST